MSLSRHARSYALLLSGIASLLALMLPLIAASAPAGGGTIAYVEGNTGDEIRLIESDGSNDRRLWAHGIPDPNEVMSVTRLDWKPDGSEIAFASSHESACSLNSSDAFAVGSNGSGYRRMTQAPGCDTLAAYPQGTVRIPVYNNSMYGNSFTGFIYFQGASSAQFVSLPAGSSTTLTFNNVADFGQDFLQVATMIVGVNREVIIGTATDVVANSTVTTSALYLYPPSHYWEAHSVTWRSDGSQLGYVLNFNSMFKLPPQPTPLDMGERIIQAEQSELPDFVDLLAWGPPSRANQLLYAGNLAYDSEGVYLVNEGSTTAGQRLLTFETWENVLGLAWLPDGSGFVYSRVETNDYYEPVSANLYLYTFSTGSATRLTNFTNLYAGMLSVSPDGQQIVFERGTELENFNSYIADPDLWTINRDGSGAELLVADGRMPDWGVIGSAPPVTPTPTTPPAPSATPTVPALPEKIFLPLVRRS